MHGIMRLAGMRQPERRIAVAPAVERGGAARHRCDHDRRVVRGGRAADDAALDQLHYLVPDQARVQGQAGPARQRRRHQGAQAAQSDLERGLLGNALGETGGDRRAGVERHARRLPARSVVPMADMVAATDLVPPPGRDARHPGVDFDHAESRPIKGGRRKIHRQPRMEPSALLRP